VTRTGRVVAGAWICVVAVGVVLLLSADAGPGSGGSDLSQVPWPLVVPVLLVGYIIGVLRNIAEDSRAMRRELEVSRHELEAIRLELTRQRVEERSVTPGQPTGAGGR
jgi:hypothetical protein